MLKYLTLKSLKQSTEKLYLTLYFIYNIKPQKVVFIKDVFSKGNICSSTINKFRKHY